MKQLQDVLYNMLEPFVFVAGHTLGAYERETDRFVPLVPSQMTTEGLRTAAQLLRVGDMPMTSWEVAANMVAQFKDAQLAVVLNDTTNIRSDNTGDSSQPNSYRTELVRRFAGEKGLVGYYINIFDKRQISLGRVRAPQGERRQLFWKESSLRQRFEMIVGHPRNTELLHDKVTVEFNEKTRLRDFLFKDIGRLSYCQLSDAPTP